VVERSGLVLLLDGVDLAGQHPRIVRCLPAQYLSGHAQVIGWIPLHPGSVRVDEPVGYAEDGVLVIEQRLCDQACWLPGGNGQPGGHLGGRRLVAMGLESGNGAVDERFDQLRVSSHGSCVRIAEGEEDGERCFRGGRLTGGLCVGMVDGEPHLSQPLVRREQSEVRSAEVGLISRYW